MRTKVDANLIGLYFIETNDLYLIFFIMFGHLTIYYNIYDYISVL